MVAQILQFLIQTAFGLLIYLFLLRFWMQVLRAPFRNPIGQFVIALTDWAVLPLRRVIPSFRGHDLATLALAWLLQLAMMVLLYAAAAGGKVNAPGVVVLVLSIVELVRASLQLLIFVVIIQVVLSWVSPGHPRSFVFESLTRPFYGFFRRFVPPIGNIDLSPLFVIVIAQVLLIVLDGAPRALLLGGG
ncbi:MAG TPA: YggT family protein [Burkholderiales bacterium]|nr:YggT family protein [Burkholderiales bacterium]